MSSNYSYPVMEDGSTDYLNKQVTWGSMEYKEQADSVIITVEYTIADEEINKYIEQGKAGAFLFVTCSVTDYRDKFVLSNEMLIPGTPLAGEVVIRPAIIALEKIDGYVNKNLNEDYADLKITIPKGGYISVGPEGAFTVSRKDNAGSESIFTFRESEEGVIKLVEDEDKLVIELPEVQYRDATSAGSQKRIYSVIYVMPALVQVIEEHWIRNGRDGDCTWSWFEVIDLALSNHYDTSNMKGESAFDAAMKILGQLIGDATDEINGLTGEDN